MTGGVESAARVLERAAATARLEGRDTLLETEGMEALRALGWPVPSWAVLTGPGDREARAHAPSGRVVVKLLSPHLPHRSDIGAVRVVEGSGDALTRTLEEVWALRPDDHARLLVQEWVPHASQPGAELLLGAHWTPDFGPVVTFGVGGITTEELQSAAGSRGLVSRFSPRLGEPDVGGGLGRLLTGRVRGGEGWASPEVLAAALTDFARLADTVLPGIVTELEVNPLVFRHGRPVPLDALARLGDGGCPARDVPALSDSRSRGIGAILAPRSVAVIGVSSRMNPGRVILRNLLGAGFPAASVQVIKPGAHEVDGCRCVPTVEALEPGVDLLVVSVAADEVPDLMERVVDGRRARGVVLIPGGLGEGGENAHRVRAVRERLRDAGSEAPVVNGGNCLGVRSVPGRVDTLFIPPEKLGFPDVPPHPVAIVSQSGAFAIARASALPWLNPRVLVTLGNQLDLTVGEYLEHLAADPELRVFACYVEGFQELDGLRFLRVARRLTREGRAVVLYRAARTGAGAAAAVSHTASMAGDFAVTRDLAGAAGVLVAESLEDFEDLVTLAVRLEGRRVPGRRLGALSNAGFECVAIADALGGLIAPRLSPATAEALTSVLAGHRLEGIVAPRNPLDLTPILGDEAFVRAAQAVLADPAIDVGAVGCVPLTPALRTLGAGPEDGVHAPGSILAGLADLWHRTEKAWLAVVDGGARYDALAQGLEAAGVPVFRRADRAVRALDAYVAWRLGSGSGPG